MAAYQPDVPGADNHDPLLGSRTPIIGATL